MALSQAVKLIQEYSDEGDDNSVSDNRKGSTSVERRAAAHYGAPSVAPRRGAGRGGRDSEGDKR